MIKTIFRLFLAFLAILIVGQAWASVSASQDDGYQYDVNSVVLGTQSYDYGAATKLRNNGVGPLPEALSRKAQARSFFALLGDFLVTKGADDIFKAGRTPKASELKKYAEGQGWKPTQTEGGPLKYVDENGIPRVTIKQGSSRAPGSGNPHVELKDATGQRIDPAGNPVTRKSPGNHTPIDYDL